MQYLKALAILVIVGYSLTVFIRAEQEENWTQLILSTISFALAVFLL